MKLLTFALALSFACSSVAGDLPSSSDQQLSRLIGFLHELDTGSMATEQPTIVRIFSSGEDNHDCGGTVASCPNVRLLFTVMMGDQGETPSLYELPKAKGWEFVRWGPTVATKDGKAATFVVRTTASGANIDLTDRSKFRPIEYRVIAGPASASYAINSKP